MTAQSNRERLEEDFACSAFAEAGEPCPLPGRGKASDEERGESGLKQIEDDLACTAFAEENEPCPIDHGKKV